MRNKKIVLSTVAALSLGTVLVTGPAPASAGQGLSQQLAAGVVLDKAVTVPRIVRFCAFGTCLEEKTLTTVVQELVVELDYTLVKDKTLPNVISRAGTLSFPEGDEERDPEGCHGREGVVLEVTATNLGATSIKGKAYGQDSGEQTLQYPPDQPPPPVGRVVLCTRPIVL